MDCSLPGSSVHGILQARILKWVAFPPPGDLPDPGIKPTFPTLEGRFSTTGPPGKSLESDLATNNPLFANNLLAADPFCL